MDEVKTAIAKLAAGHLKYETSDELATRILQYLGDTNPVLTTIVKAIVIVRNEERYVEGEGGFNDRGRMVAKIAALMDELPA